MTFCTLCRSTKPPTCTTIFDWNGAGYCFPGQFRRVLRSIPPVKRFATRVEDHPVEYGDFEGVIPEGEYGGGTVMLWDRGTWTAEVPHVDEALQKGDLKFTLHGRRLKGSWVLVRTRSGYGGRGKESWLLIKHRDRYASSEDVVATHPRSVASRRLLAGIARDSGGNVPKAAKGDPARAGAR